VGSARRLHARFRSAQHGESDKHLGADRLIIGTPPRHLLDRQRLAPRVALLLQVVKI